jgi:glucosamine--fructose-6-phosphate aminotransferase (isomerizing)
VTVAGLRCRDALELPTLPCEPCLAPILLCQTFYGLADAVSIARGLDPDRPPHLSKVTETV